ncbi:GspE/PulE family protein [Crateriforma conspicua]|uniref:GspE/PulE family protein n=1 Tax=Crateriforma conspicua TaxID=2527996 RepID=UPI001189800A|nr:ATPase, T2SS/T4P/T4SS family [Crateriforma conspicua]QDV61737.1 Type II secretion system protein E [Crateriforma conspicua]
MLLSVLPFDQLSFEDSLDRFDGDPVFLDRIPIQHARRHKIIGVRPTASGSAETSAGLLLAIGDQRSLPQCDIVARRLRTAVQPIRCDADVVAAKIDQAYAQRDRDARHLLHSIDTQRVGEPTIGTSIRPEDLLDSDRRPPVIQLVNQLLFDAVVAGASDLHIQPRDDRLQIRQRIDGVMFDVVEVPKSIQEEVISRIKVLGRMNIAEKRLPQDGRATVTLGDRNVDLRIASLPTSHSERIVIRLLDKSVRRYTLDELGMPPAMLQQWQQLISVDHGLILVTGPTGSGKSTTLYGALQTLNSSETNILTLEDPIEYQLPGISQTQINEKKGMTFASGLRSLLRQDPDVIMVGEIRDQETATMAIQASLTGHLVFSTLHTNDAASAITRMLDLGVQPYLLASSLVGSLAQRLVRTLCPHCKTTAGRTMPGGEPEPVSANGCSQCRQTGYSGRIGIFELLVVDEIIRRHIQDRSGARTIRDSAQAAGMQLLSDDGQHKIAQGLTTAQEVARVTVVNQPNADGNVVT